MAHTATMEHHRVNAINTAVHQATIQQIQSEVEQQHGLRVTRMQEQFDAQVQELLY